MNGDEHLSVLVGGHLDTVSFVMDYVELRIGYNVFRALNPPRVQLHDGTEASFPEPGSRDALCRLIDSEIDTAREVRDAAGDRIEIRTNRGDTLIVDIDDSGQVEPAHLVPANEEGQLEPGRMYIW